ncbi:MAG: hypothetical protein LUC49_04320 [Prevotella sp.]|nr:hypothetical protein [Prevotella sp.]
MLLFIIVKDFFSLCKNKEKGEYSNEKRERMSCQKNGGALKRRANESNGIYFFCRVQPEFGEVKRRRHL